MTILSDEEATSIRGFGWKSSNGSHGGSSVAISGNSRADIITPLGFAHSEDAFAAEGKHFAKGANGSHAGVELSISSGHKGGKKNSGNHGGSWGNKGGHGTKSPRNGGHHGNGKTTTIRFKVFAGGFAWAKAH
jgi:hypothetical protein